MSFLLCDAATKEKKVLHFINGTNAEDIPFFIFGSIKNKEDLKEFNKVKSDIQKIIQSLLDSGKIIVCDKFRLYPAPKETLYTLDFDYNSHEQIIGVNINIASYNQDYKKRTYESLRSLYRDALDSLETNIQFSKQDIEEMTEGMQRTENSRQFILKLIVALETMN